MELTHSFICHRLGGTRLSRSPQRLKPRIFRGSHSYLASVAENLPPELSEGRSQADKLSEQGTVSLNKFFPLDFDSKQRCCQSKFLFKQYRRQVDEVHFSLKSIVARENETSSCSWAFFLSSAVVRASFSLNKTFIR